MAKDTDNSDTQALAFELKEFATETANKARNQAIGVLAFVTLILSLAGALGVWGAAKTTISNEVADMWKNKVAQELENVHNNYRSQIEGIEREHESEIAKIRNAYKDNILRLENTIVAELTRLNTESETIRNSIRDTANEAKAILPQIKMIKENANSHKEHAKSIVDDLMKDMSTVTDQILTIIKEKDQIVFDGKVLVGSLYSRSSVESEVFVAEKGTVQARLESKGLYITDNEKRPVIRLVRDTPENESIDSNDITPHLAILNSQSNKEGIVLYSRNDGTSAFRLLDNDSKTRMQMFTSPNEDTHELRQYIYPSGGPASMVKWPSSFASSRRIVVGHVDKDDVKGTGGIEITENNGIYTLVHPNIPGTKVTVFVNQVIEERRGAPVYRLKVKHLDNPLKCEVRVLDTNNATGGKASFNFISFQTQVN